MVALYGPAGTRVRKIPPKADISVSGSVLAAGLPPFTTNHPEKEDTGRPHQTAPGLFHIFCFYDLQVGVRALSSVTCGYRHVLPTSPKSFLGALNTSTGRLS